MQTLSGRLGYQPGGTGGSSLLKPGVNVQQIKLSTDIPIPGATQGVTKIPAGETVLVIRTPKGVYIRTPQGKIFAVRSTPKGADSAAGGSGGGATMEDLVNRQLKENGASMPDDASRGWYYSIFVQYVCQFITSTYVNVYHWK